MSEIQKPSIGRIVIVTCPDIMRNGTNEFPAIVTQTFGGLVANIKAMPPGAEPFDLFSTPHDSARETGYQSATWRWPERV